MKSFLIVSCVLAVMTASFAARAWDGDPLWYDPAHGAKMQPYDVPPGGGGILGTGGVGDHNITCAHCHIKGADKYGTITVAFNPPFGSTYTPNKKYDITVMLQKEHLGLSGCGQYVNGNINEFAATFETDAGKLAGVLAGTYGSSASCPTDPPPVGFTGSTFLYRDCHAVVAASVKDRTQWTFSWTAPPPGSGNVTLHYGAVDGDCKMDSLMDDVKVGNIVLGEGVAALTLPPRRENEGASPSPSSNALAWFGLVPAVALIGASHRRRRTRSD